MNYVRNVRYELETARQRRFPIFVIYNTKLTTGEHIELERLLAGCNVIKTATRDVDLSGSQKDIQRQIADLFEKANFINDLHEFQRDYKEKDLFVIIADKNYIRSVQVPIRIQRR